MVFESDTVENDCPMQENYKIFKDLIHTDCWFIFLVLLFVQEILKKKKKKL